MNQIAMVIYPREAGDVYINVYSVDAFYDIGDGSLRVLVRGERVDIPKLTPEEFHRNIRQAIKDHRVEVEIANERTVRKLAETHAQAFKEEGL